MSKQKKSNADLDLSLGVPIEPKWDVLMYVPGLVRARLEQGLGLWTKILGGLFQEGALTVIPAGSMLPLEVMAISHTEELTNEAGNFIEGKLLIQAERVRVMADAPDDPAPIKLAVGSVTIPLSDAQAQHLVLMVRKLIDPLKANSPQAAAAAAEMARMQVDEQERRRLADLGIIAPPGTRFKQ